jgi:hypothetical protein
MNHLSICPVVNILTAVGDRHEISGAIAFPAAALVSRMPWSVDPRLPDTPDLVAFFRRGTYLATGNTFQDVQLDIAYKHRISAAMRVCLSYSFEWLHFSEPKHITQMVSNVSVGVEL